MNGIVESIIHLDRSLGHIIQEYGVWTYLLVFIVIYAEVGLVVTGFLPGDSLLFAVGALAATGALNQWFLFVLLSVAAVIGNISNFGIGCWLGPGILKKEKIPFIKKAHLDYTHRFYERHGGKTIVIARFLPIVRSFAPLVGGISAMRAGRFIVYSVFAGIGWVGLYLWGGYFFGAMSFVKENFSLVIVAVILVSILPGVIGFLRHLAANTTRGAG